MSSRRALRAQAMVEFSIVAPVLILIIFGLVDASRIAQASVTVAEAARDGVRQAVADEAAADAPFAAAGTGPCPSSTPTSSASGMGCLTDTRIAETVAARLAPLTSSYTLHPGVRADACPAPSPGSASICIDPSDSAASKFSTCTAAVASLGHEPGPGDLGGRQAEWTSRADAGCFVVQVTVVFGYSPLTPAIGRLLPSAFLISSTSVVPAEY